MVFIAVKIQVKVWVVTLWSVAVWYQHFRGPHCIQLHPADGGSIVLWNVGILQQHQHYMVTWPKRPQH